MSTLDHQGDGSRMAGEDASVVLSDLIARKLRVTIDPAELRHFVNDHFRKLSVCGHAIHDDRSDIA